MTLLRRLASIAQWILRRDRAETQLDDELQAFIEASVAEKVRDGMAPDEARRLARLELGGVEQVKEQVRTRRHGHLLDEAGRDLRYAVRMFVRTPGFTLVILLTLALGIGANTAIFSLIDALMLRSLPVKHPQELQLVNLRDRKNLAEGGETFSVAIARALDDQRDIFAGAGGFTTQTFDVGPAGGATRVSGAIVTGGFFNTLGLSPAAGRLLTREDDVAGAPLVAVISDGYWNRQFARSASVIGQTIVLNGVPTTIVGVTPAGFVGAGVGSIADITTSVATMPQLHRGLGDLLGPGVFWLRVLARPAAGVSAAQAASRLNGRWPALSDALISPRWTPARRQAMADSLFVFENGAIGWSPLRQTYGKPLAVLMAVAGSVLLIACANVASLFLARATTRIREMSVRLAIGASRGRIVRQLVIEGTLLSSAGALLGIGVAWASGRFLVGMMTTSADRLEFDMTPNSHVLIFSAALAIATGIVFGLAPAFQMREAQPSLAFRGDERTATRRSRLLPSLVMGQVALSLVLLAGAGLFVRSLINLQQLNPGFSADGVFVVGLNRDLSPTPARLAEIARAVPGVMAAAPTTHTPLDGSSWSEAIVPAGQPVPDTDNTHVIAAGAGFFEALRIPLSAGRAFGDVDMTSGGAVAVVNERYAAMIFPKQNPIGQRIIGTLFGQNADMEIVGVVADTKAENLRELPPPMVYVPYPRFGARLSPSLAIRAAGSPGVVAESIRRALQPEVPSWPLQVQPLSAQLNKTLVQDNMLATLAAGFGVLALVLCAVGLYGLLAYSVAQRSKEIGIRMALGAHSGRVVSDVIANAFRLVGIGLALGIPAAWAASHSLQSMLFGLKATDPSVMVVAVTLLVAAALVASFFPARRASRVDPLTALRHE